jgi:hypothetical protein
MTQESALARAERVLTPRELEAYRRYIESSKPPLAPSTSASMFALFLQGHTCEEIAKLNPAFGLGIIVKARVDFDWDKQREEHLQHLLDNIRSVVQTTQLEAVQFVAEGLAVYRKMAGEKFQKYLQSGKIEDLGDFKDMSFKTYKDLLELLLKLTGQEPTKKVQGEVMHRHTVEATQDAPRADRPMSASDATDFLSRFDLPKIGNS